MQELQSHQTLENGLRVAKSDSLSVKLSDREGSEDNGYSANVLIKAYEASINSGHVMCKACNKNHECTQKTIPLFLTGNGFVFPPRKSGIRKKILKTMINWILFVKKL